MDCLAVKILDLVLLRQRRVGLWSEFHMDALLRQFIKGMENLYCMRTLRGEDAWEQVVKLHRARHRILFPVLFYERCPPPAPVVVIGHFVRGRNAVEGDEGGACWWDCFPEAGGVQQFKSADTDDASLRFTMPLVGDDFSLWEKVKFPNMSVDPFLFADESCFSVVLVDGRFRVGDEFIPDFCVSANFEAVQTAAASNSAFAPVASDDEVFFGFICDEV